MFYFSIYIYILERIIPHVSFFSEGLLSHQAEKKLSKLKSSEFFLVGGVKTCFTWEVTWSHYRNSVQTGSDPLGPQVATARRSAFGWPFAGGQLDVAPQIAPSESAGKDSCPKGVPICSMYGVFTHFWVIFWYFFKAHGKYSIRGDVGHMGYGFVQSYPSCLNMLKHQALKKGTWQTVASHCR